MPVEQDTTTKITCDNPSCPSPQQGLPTGLSNEALYGWLLVTYEVYGQPSKSHVFCSPDCAAAVADFIPYIRDVSSTTGAKDDVIKIDGQGFEGLETATIGSVTQELDVQDNNHASFTVGSAQEATSGPLVLNGPRGSVTSLFDMSVAVDPEQQAAREQAAQIEETAEQQD